MLESIKVEFETNERLLEDYPEAVFPIHALERIHNRAKDLHNDVTVFISAGDE